MPLKSPLPLTTLGSAGFPVRIGSRNLVKKAMPAATRMLLCVHDKYSSTLARFWGSSGYQKSSTGYFFVMYRRMATLSVSLKSPSWITGRRWNRPIFFWNSSVRCSSGNYSIENYGNGIGHIILTFPERNDFLLYGDVGHLEEGQQSPRRG